MKFRKKDIRRHGKLYFSVSIMLILSILFSMSTTVYCAEEESYKETFTRRVETPRPSVNGRLSVKSGQLVDKDSKPVQLRGVSTHGLTWYPDFINNGLIDTVSKSWNCNLLRLAAYSTEYKGDGVNTTLELVRKGIDAAIASDMYVIVDWHILEDSNPNIHLKEAMEFFDIISSEYADAPNVLYEICNEPNGETFWSDIFTYANQVIPVIRKNAPDSVIIVGTPDYSRNLMMVRRRPLLYDNLMYTLHFYAATHKSDLQNELLMAINKKIPVFVTECGLSESSGDGKVDYESAVKWFKILNDNKISYTVWSFSNKNESSAMFKPWYIPGAGISEDSLTSCGKWVRSLIQGETPGFIEVPKDEGIMLPAWITDTLNHRDYTVAKAWPRLALLSLLILILSMIVVRSISLYTFKRYNTFKDLYDSDKTAVKSEKNINMALKRVVLILGIFFTITYLIWRIRFSIPKNGMIITIIANVVLLIVEMIGFCEALVLYGNLMGLRKYELPEISDEEYPDVDIFIATYNEPVELLRKTINGCNHLKYPDKSKVHIWLCDDNRRPEMRKLAAEMGIGYFDRPDNKGAKAGNLNNALGKTSAPYIVTLDSDMIVKSDFLLKTIPYFVDAKKKSEALPEDKRYDLGFIQTPQSFYDPDVFQYALYSEKTAPNEQDFFYRTIEVAKTATNSVIYGGSNTILSRAALEEIGGFYTETITEDFATGMLIEAAGYVSLALPEPLANGETPHTFKEHIQQRKRWGRGVISTARKLHLIRRKGLSPAQKISYLSSVSYWYSPIKNLIYLISPLMFSAFAIPVFACSWLDLLIYWFPMFVMQEICLRFLSGNLISLKWSGIHETSVMPYMLFPILKESLGITTTTFAVTDKSGKKKIEKNKLKTMMPFIVLLVLSGIGCIRILYLMQSMHIMSLIILLFWILRNAYFLGMSVFLISGRDEDNEAVNVIDAEPVSIKNAGEGNVLYGITTYMNEHNVRVFLDEEADLRIGDRVEVTIESEDYTAVLNTVVCSLKNSRSGGHTVYSFEILDYGDSEFEYMQILYDRVPSLPQSLNRDWGIVLHMMKNIAYRILNI